VGLSNLGCIVSILRRLAKMLLQVELEILQPTFWNRWFTLVGGLIQNLDDAVVHLEDDFCLVRTVIKGADDFLR